MSSSHLSLVPELEALLSVHFTGLVSIHPAGGKGNHHTYLLTHAGGRAFVGVEDGPEGDGHLAVESRVMAEVAAAGVRVPRVLFTDASRTTVPFAVQVIEYGGGGCRHWEVPSSRHARLFPLRASLWLWIA